MDQFFIDYEGEQRKGLTEEQFMMEIWRNESARRQQEELQASQEPESRDWLQNNYSATQALGGDLFQQQSPQSQQLYEGLKHDLRMNLQYLQSQQEQHWKQLNIRFDQMTMEFRSGIESLSNLVSNIADTNTGSIKLHFMQELELLKQDFMKVVTTNHHISNGPTTNHISNEPTTNHISNETGHVASEISFQRGEQAAAKLKVPQNLLSGVVKPNIDTCTQINCRNENKLDDILQQSTSQPLSTKHQLKISRSELSLEKHLLSQQDTSYTAAGQGAVNRTLEKDSQWNVGVKSYAKAVTLTAQAHAPGITKNSKFIGRPEDASIYHPPSFTTSHGSVEATGPYAEAVSNQFEQKQSSRASSVSSRRRSDSSSSLKNTTGSKPARNDNSLSLVIVDPGQKMFTIYNSEQFSVSNKPYLSDAMYSSGRPIRARVRVNIETTGVLTVYIHVSKGVHDDSHKWPLQLSGCGYIWNIPSKRHTQIWQLHPILCQKPSSDKEFTFPADICLTTLRGSYPKIKYQKLADKHYAEENRLTFEWDLRAVEN